VLCKVNFLGAKASLAPQYELAWDKRLQRNRLQAANCKLVGAKCVSSRQKERKRFEGGAGALRTALPQSCAISIMEGDFVKRALCGHR
jgi:hypothetical protein